MGLINNMKWKNKFDERKKEKRKKKRKKKCYLQ